MKFFLHPLAKEELQQGLDFYQQQQVGLEKRFLEAVDDAIHRICRNPMLYRKVDHQTRKCRVLHFPYALVFRLDKQSITIIAVMHLRKQPKYWLSRK